MVYEGRVNTFVSLQTSYDEYGGRDYRLMLQELFTPPMEPPFEVKFLHCPISDFGTMDDRTLVAFITELQSLLVIPSNTLYIHCYGGHGRTGTVVVQLITAVTGRCLSEALVLLKRAHKFRKDHRGRKCCDCSLANGELEDVQQSEQGARMHGMMSRQKKLHGISRKK